MIKKLVGLALALCAMLAAVPASATMIYAIAGTFSGKLTTNVGTNPVVHNFNDVDLVFGGLSDGSAATVSHSLGFDVLSYSLSDFEITDGLDFVSLPNFSFIVVPSRQLVGFAGPQGVLFTVRLPDPFDGTQQYGPVSTSDIRQSEAATYRGNRIKLNNVTNGAFLAFDIPAVPEAATWAMFIIGFGGIGFGLRRRQPASIFA